MRRWRWGFKVFRAEHVHSPSCFTTHSIDAVFSSTIIMETRKLCRQQLLQANTSKGPFSFRSSLLILLLLFAIDASLKGARLSLASMLRSHDKIWNDLFQKRLFVDDLLWLAICNEKWFVKCLSIKRSHDDCQSRREVNVLTHSSTRYHYNIKDPLMEKPN